MSSQHARLSDSYDDDTVNKRGGTPSRCDMNSGQPLEMRTLLPHKVLVHCQKMLYGQGCEHCRSVIRTLSHQGVWTRTESSDPLLWSGETWGVWRLRGLAAVEDELPGCH